MPEQRAFGLRRAGCDMFGNQHFDEGLPGYAEAPGFLVQGMYHPNGKVHEIGVSLIFEQFFRRGVLAESKSEPGRFQKQPHDHVLREKERERDAFQRICYYIQENPVRKSLAEDWAEYSYTGCIVPGYPELDMRSEDYWDRFWRVYGFLRGTESSS